MPAQPATAIKHATPTKDFIGTFQAYGVSRPSNNEFNLLAAFLAAPQRILSRDQILGLSRLHNDEVYDRSVDVQVGRLPRKIQPGKSSPELIRTERGAGYVFTAAVEIVR